MKNSIREIKGIGQVINWETAKFLAGKYKYINREQDLGIEGLAPGQEIVRPGIYRQRLFPGKKELKRVAGRRSAYCSGSRAMTPFSISRSTCLLTMSAKRRKWGMVMWA